MRVCLVEGGRAVAVRVCLWYKVKGSSGEYVTGVGWKGSSSQNVNGTGRKGSISDNV